MRAHPSRSSYAAGCRCPACTRANTEYQRQRATRREPGRVDAARTRNHILALSAMHVGRRAVADACDLDPRTVQAIRNSKRQVIYATTARRILAVDENARADGSLVPAAPMKRAIRALQRRGYSVRFLSQHLGLSSPSLPVYRRAERCQARTASRVERLIRLINAGKVSR